MYEGANEGACIEQQGPVVQKQVSLTQWVNSKSKANFPRAYL